MNNKYIYRRRVQGHRQSKLKRRLIWFGILLAIVLAVIIWIILDLHSPDPGVSRASKIENTVVSDNMQTVTSPYFKFQDTARWVFDSENSTPNKFVYQKFNKLDHQGTLVVYVNQIPIPLYLATPRVLPVRIFNGSSFDVTQISDPCGKTYGKELHKVKMVTIYGAQMLCDPDSPQYFVQLALITGDYRLNLKRANGTVVQFVITYKDTTLEPNSKTLIQVAKSFQAL